MENKNIQYICKVHGISSCMLSPQNNQVLCSRTYLAQRLSAAIAARGHLLKQVGNHLHGVKSTVTDSVHLRDARDQRAEVKEHLKESNQETLHGHSWTF